MNSSSNYLVSINWQPRETSVNYTSQDCISPRAPQSQEKFKVRLWLCPVGQILLTLMSLLLSCKFYPLSSIDLGNFLELYWYFWPQHTKCFTILASIMAHWQRMGYFTGKRLRSILILAYGSTICSKCIYNWHFHWRRFICILP